MNKKSVFAIASVLTLASASHLCAIEARDFSDQTRWVLTLDMQAAHASPMLAFVADQIDTAKRQEAERKLAAIEAMFGVNLKKDIDHIVIAGNGDASKGGVAYVYGRFDTQRLTTILAGADDYSTSNHHGTVIQRWHDNSDKKKKCAAFAKPGLALFSDQVEPLAQALDVLGARRPSLPADTPLRAAFTPSPGDVLTLHATGLSDIVGSQPNAQALRQAAALSLRIGTPDAETLKATLAVTAADEQTAQQVYQALMGIRALAMLRAAEEPETAALATQIGISCDGTTVQVDFGISKTQLHTALQNRKARLAAKPAPAATAP
ncbi:MAG TPA: hypothetical protein P5026_06415 [Kiritimatiellia bacterium]|nr:hypothetical protein [Kiritimatiellia bacterium]HRU70775.1 hypothetical protein [Kiritimatiellia bacterium]